MNSYCGVVRPEMERFQSGNRLVRPNVQSKNAILEVQLVLAIGRDLNAEEVDPRYLSFSWLEMGSVLHRTVRGSV